jgi:hypothetical protein
LGFRLGFIYAIRTEVEPFKGVKMSTKTTLSKLRALVREHFAEDITSVSEDRINELRRKGLTKVALARGVYGMIGGEFQTDDGNRYVILARNANLFRVA